MAKTQNYSAETQERRRSGWCGSMPGITRAECAAIERGRAAAGDRQRGDAAQVGAPGRDGRGEAAGDDHGGGRGGPGAEAEGVGAGADDPDPDGGDPFFRPGGRPATAVICAFIASAFRTVFGVVPACRALSAHGIAISPRTYHARRSRPPSRRALRDAWLTGLLRADLRAGTERAGGSRSRCTGR